MEQSTHPLTNFQPQRNKCKQLTIHFHKLLITLCGDTNTSSRRRFWYILLIFAISSYIMCIADVLTEYRWQKQPPLILPDLGFDFAQIVTPSICKWIKYPDIAVIISIVFTFTWIIIDGPQYQKLAIFRRFLTMMSILYFGRSICVVMTQLPTPFRSDTDITNWNNNLFYEAFLVLCRVKATNNDVFYSGHTVVITMCAVLLETYCKRRWLIWLLWIYSIFTLYVIIATKFHYTIDVFIAFILSLVIWKFYHMTMTIKIMRNHLPIFKWFESDKEAAIYSASSDNMLHQTSLTTSLTTSNVLNEYNYNLNKIQLNNNHIFSEISEEHKDSNTNYTTPKSKSLKSISMDLP